jgi:hypothetical protein
LNNVRILIFRILKKISVDGIERRKNRRIAKNWELKNGAKEGRKSKSEQDWRTDVKTLWLGTL